MKRKVFHEDNVGEVWIDGESAFSDSKTLLTISNTRGEHSVLITPEQITQSDAKLYVQAPPERVTPESKVSRKQKIAKALSYVAYGIAATLVLFILLSSAGLIQARTVLTGSMEPTINPGDVVILQPLNGSVPAIGDIVTYTGKRFDGTEVAKFTHRIIEGNAQEGFVLKGDANENADIQKVQVSDIVGKVAFTVPFVGRILAPQTLFTLVPLLFIGWLVINRFLND